jgi:carbonic anhydrase
MEDLQGTATDRLVANAVQHQARFEGPRAVVPTRNVAIVTCMDSRIDIFRVFGLDSGEAHILRNAGGLVTDDILRSLVVSQRKLHTREIILMHHTDCGLCGMNEDAFRSQISAEAGLEFPLALGAFDDVDEALRQSLARVRSYPFLLHRDRVRGFVYEVETGRVREVVP